MTRTALCRFSPSLICAFAGACLAISGAAPASAGEDGPQCGVRLTGIGFPRPTAQLAELSAIGNWLEAAGRLGDDMASWHRAKGKSMKCDEIGKLGRIACTVVAQPCSGLPDGEAAAAVPAQ